MEDEEAGGPVARTTRLRPADLPPTRMPDGGSYRALPHRTISPATKLAAFASADAARERPGSWLAAQ